MIGLSYGFAFGSEGGNQLTYIPPGIRLIDPEFLQRDWWASETSIYHVPFSYLIAALHWLHLLPWVAALGNVLLIAATYWCIFRLVAQISPQNAFSIWIIFAFLFVGIARSQSVAGSYLFDAELQPSSISSAATVLAMYFFVAGRPLASGVALAVAGLFHTNFLILGLLCFGLGQLFLGWRSLFRRSFQQLLPSMIVLAANIPLIFRISGRDLPPEMLTAAGRLVIEVAAPHHYQPLSFLVGFIPLIGWNIIALPMLKMLPAGWEGRRNFVAIYLSLLLVITVGTLLTTAVMVEFVSRLFVWRMAPFVLFCAHVTIAVAASRFLTNASEDRGDWIGRLLPWLAALGCALILLFLLKRSPLFDLRLWISLLGAMGLVAACWRGYAIGGKAAGRGDRFPIIVPVLAVALVVATIPNAITVSNAGISVTRNFNLLAAPTNDRPRIELYRWARTTDRNSKFLIPPMLSGFRLHAERAIYVDWKARPFRPDELIEWHRRIRSITGLDRWQNLSDLDKAYDLLGEAQIRSIAASYEIDYVVLHKSATDGRSLGNVVFANDVYWVVRLSHGAASNWRGRNSF